MSEKETQQILRPSEVVDGLLKNIFRIKNVLDAVVLVVSLATLMAMVLVFALSMRLRQREIGTIFKIGCSRMTIAKLMAAEVLIILAASGSLCAILLMGVDRFKNDLIRMLIIG